MKLHHSSLPTGEEEYTNSWCYWSAMHSALYIDSSIYNPSVCMPVQHSCEEINGMRSLEGDIEYIL